MLVLTLKFKYNRPRPKKFMQQMNDSFPHERITSNKSPSYPSGHTAHAFFNCVIIAAMHPDHEMRLRSLAEQIGQSRIDLGKHYPSDVSYGRFIGEFVGKKYLNGGAVDNKKDVKETVMTRENRKIARNLLREAASNHDTKSLGTTYTDELCEFIIRSNAIERYHFPISDAYEAAKSLGMGYWRMHFLIVLPQALKLVIPGIANTFLALVKDTPLIFVVGLLELAGMVNLAKTNPKWLGMAMEGYVFAGLVFWVICYAMSRYSQNLERKLSTERQ